jgi:hypothetical protein
MEFRQLGRSRVKVSPLGLGTARMVGLGWHDDLALQGRPQAKRDAVRQIQEAVDLGVTFFDTADENGVALFMDLTPGKYCVHPLRNFGMTTRQNLEVYVSSDEIAAVVWDRKRIIINPLLNPANKFAATRARSLPAQAKTRDNKTV